jgi:cobalt-zinc-cadmium efflux system protein
MAHTHSHPCAPGSSTGAEPRGAPRELRIAFAITSTTLVLEAAGGWWTGSVALLADAGHMLTDAGALSIALLGGWMAGRPRTAQKSFGYGRAEILAALVNGMLLGAVSTSIAVESIRRLATPTSIDAGPMVAIALVGLVANLVCASFLAHGSHTNLNVRAAFFHVVGDAMGSVAAILAGVSVWLWDFLVADAVAGLAIAGLLVVSAVRLVRDSVDILLEAAPRHLDVAGIAAEMAALPGVRAVHDLHIWTVTSGFPAMSAHVDIEPGADPAAVRRALHQLLHQRYEIEHTTIQTEEPRESPLLSILDSGHGPGSA